MTARFFFQVWISFWLLLWTLSWSGISALEQWLDRRTMEINSDPCSPPFVLLYSRPPIILWHRQSVWGWGVEVQACITLSEICGKYYCSVFHETYKKNGSVIVLHLCCIQCSKTNEMHFLYSVHYELTTCTCFEHYLLIFRRSAQTTNRYIACV
jgi:hypothetical protein